MRIAIIPAALALAFDALLSVLVGELDVTVLGGGIPGIFAGTGSSLLLNLLPTDPAFPPFNLGVADAHELQIQ